LLASALLSGALPIHLFGHSRADICVIMHDVSMCYFAGWSLLTAGGIWFFNFSKYLFISFNYSFAVV